MPDIVVSLLDFFDTLEELTTESRGYLNKVTGELLTVANEDMSVVEDDEDWSEYPEWQQEIFEKAKEVYESDEYMEILRKHEINDYGIMEDFSLSYPNERISSFLNRSIRGSGAFRRFRETLDHFDIEEEWYAFRNEAYKQIAIRWLEANDFAYVDDFIRRRRAQEEDDFLANS